MLQFLKIFKIISVPKDLFGIELQVKYTIKIDSLDAYK